MARALADIERDISELSQKERTDLLRKVIDDLDAPSKQIQTLLGSRSQSDVWVKLSADPLGHSRERT